MSALIELSGVTRSYEVGGGTLQVLKGIDLVIEEGDFVAVMGPRARANPRSPRFSACSTARRRGRTS